MIRLLDHAFISLIGKTEGDVPPQTGLGGYRYVALAEETDDVWPRSWIDVWAKVQGRGK